MAVRLFVGNLPYSLTEAELKEHFAAVGPVSGVWLPTDRETGRPRGFGFVEFEDRELALTAIRQFHNQPLKGRPISVNEARPQERGQGGPPPPRRPPGPMGDSSRPPVARPPRQFERSSDSPPPRPAPRWTGPAPEIEPDPGALDRTRSVERRVKKPVRSKKDKDWDRGGPRKPMKFVSGGRFYSDMDDVDEDDVDDIGFDEVDDAVDEFDDDVEADTDEADEDKDNKPT